MDGDQKALIGRLNDPSREKRLAAAYEAGNVIAEGGLTVKQTDEVNNHVHTIYSFSPYSPTMAAFKAWEAGLKAVGIMDHDSVAGCEELIEAGKRIGIATTAGFELRVNFSGTKLEGRRINSPDSKNIAYIAVHGIPHTRFRDAEAFLEPLNEYRNERNRVQVRKLNEIISSYGMEPIDFYTEVYPLSRAKEGGSITERHILFALVKKIIARTGKGKAVVNFVETTLNVPIPQTIKGYLNDSKNPHYEYDLLGVLKSSFLPLIFVQPDYDECPSVLSIVEFVKQIGAIPAYAYLGDVCESPTGDKKAQKFEDDFLDELIDEITRIGFKAVTYMPPRNSARQLERIQRLCKEHDLMEISGVDINSSRQSFNCPIILEPRFIHLADATWALIAHEKTATEWGDKYALFSDDNPLKTLPLKEKITKYSTIGRELDPKNPEKIPDWE
jgi:predicted metal-dependent phosphoesterase TrpH